tara:strand:+ start:106 stop:768 length:663 start_codon:yes stop_codon:yes gene_type:complete
MEFALHKDIEVIKKTLLAATLLAATGAAHAGFVEYDWETAGDGQVTLDTTSGNLWLDLDVTANMSINEVKELVANDARYAGWRLPTLTELYQLASNMFVTIDPETQYRGTTRHTSGNAAHYLMGQAGGGAYTYGIYEKNGGTYLFGSGPNGLYLNYAWDSSGLDWSRVHEGVYLVSTDYNISVDSTQINNDMNVSDVSAPLGFAATGLLLGFAGMRRRNA